MYLVFPWETVPLYCRFPRFGVHEPHPVVPRCKQSVCGLSEHREGLSQPGPWDSTPGIPLEQLAKSRKPGTFKFYEQ